MSRLALHLSSSISHLACVATNDQMINVKSMKNVKWSMTNTSESSK